LRPPDESLPTHHNARPIWGKDLAGGEVTILSCGFAEVRFLPQQNQEEQKVTLGFGEVKKWS